MLEQDNQRKPFPIRDLLIGSTAVLVVIGMIICFSYLQMQKSESYERYLKGTMNLSTCEFIVNHMLNNAHDPYPDVYDVWKGQFNDENCIKFYPKSFAQLESIRNEIDVKDGSES